MFLIQKHSKISLPQGSLAVTQLKKNLFSLLCSDIAQTDHVEAKWESI